MVAHGGKQKIKQINVCYCSHQSMLWRQVCSCLFQRPCRSSSPSKHPHHHRQKPRRHYPERHQASCRRPRVRRRHPAGNPASITDHESSSDQLCSYSMRHCKCPVFFSFSACRGSKPGVSTAIIAGISRSRIPHSSFLGHTHFFFQ